MSLNPPARGHAVRLTPPLAMSIGIALCCCLSPAVAASQVVRGVVVDASSGQAIPGVIVVLLDSTGKRLAGVLAGEDGRYALRAMAAGRYSVRAERIGFHADAPASVTLGPGETVELRLATRPFPVVLGAVRVTGRTPCVARASDGREVSTVWDEARKALYAADLTERNELFTVRVSRFQRVLDPRTGRVVQHESTERTGASRSPFVSASPARLSADGFVQRTGNDLVYWGPDATVLLSDEFLADHCFRLTDGGGNRTGLIGLTFEPVRQRDKPDIAGTLWIDRRSAELRDIEYVYRNLPDLPGEVSSERFGGRIEFHRMPTGAWIVERWVIRMPVLRDAGPLARRNESVIPGTPMNPTDRVQLAAVREEGGEVLESVARGEHRAVAGERASVRGTVFDSTRMRPLPNARVFLDGTQFSGTSGSDGRFAIEGVPTGAYSLSVVHPRFDSLHVRAPVVPVALRVGEPATADLAGPSAATILAHDCTAEALRRGPAALRGYIRDATSGRPAIDARVAATWNRLDNAAARAATVSERRVEARTDSAGSYALCGLPEDVKLTVSAAAEDRRATPVQLALAGREVAVLDLTVDAPAVGSPAPATQLAPVAVRASAPRNREVRELERRRQRGVGQHLVREQIDRLHPARITDLLRTVPGVTVLPDERGVMVVELRGSMRVGFDPSPTASQSADSSGRSRGQLTSRIVSPTTLQRCPAGFQVDGLPVDASGGIDSELQPEDVEAIEVYTGVQVPIELSGHSSSCGLVLIWTRRFLQRPDAPPPKRDHQP